MFVDAFLGAGVPLGGDPITSFDIVPLLGLRTGTVLDNCKPMVGDIVRVRLIATNFGDKRLEIVRSVEEGQERDDEYSANNAVTLLPGESLEFSTFRSWEVPGKQQVTVAYEVRCAGLPFARLAYPTVAVHVRPLEGIRLMQWVLDTGRLLIGAH